MPTTSTMRVTALLTLALTLAACGSDKAAGPTTANNAQIISEMKETLADSDSFSYTDLYKFISLQLAVAGLSSGSPVNQANVTIGERSYRFNTISITVEDQDSASGGAIERTNVIVGWRHTNGDTLFVAMYGPPAEVATDRRTSLALMQRSTSAGSRLGELGRMLRSGRQSVSKSISAGGPDQPLVLAVYLGDSLFVADDVDDFVSGSASYSSVSGECDIPVEGYDVFILQLDPDSCEPQSSSVALRANTWDVLAETDSLPAGPAVTIPTQSVVGVKLVTLRGAVPM
ncbi:MAG TPA: hypothetical protein VFR95_02190 [Gemmatimonadaceae bacterium]|nr:hypothetical protein [Gemmatimonadaceae bacterium]